MASNQYKEEESLPVNEPIEPKEKKERKKKADKNAAGEKKYFFQDERFLKILGLVFIFISLCFFIAFTSYLFTWTVDFAGAAQSSWWDILTKKLEVRNILGQIGAKISHLFFYKLFGVASFLTIPIFFMTGISLLLKQTLQLASKTFKYSFFFLVWLSAAFSFIFSVLISNGFPWGGALGEFLYGKEGWLINLLGIPGSGALLGFTFIGYLVVAHNINFNIQLFDKKPDEAQEEKQPEIIITNPTEPTNTFINEPVLPVNIELQNENENRSIELEVENTQEKTETPDEDIQLEVLPTMEEEKSDEEEIEIQTNYDPTLDLSSYEYPPFELLEEYGSNKIQINEEELKKNSQQIIDTLKNYGIGIASIKATVGPTVTLYEIVPEAGIRISKIKNLEDDIALSLAALGIRIIAPIPGKGTIGIEVPNIKKETVSMRSLLESEKFRTAQMDLPIALGKTISNEIFIADLAKMPHLLIAGATGQGKSVGINALLVSLLYKKHPSWLKLVLIDPKKVELTLYNKIEKHFLAKLPGEEEAIITDTKKVINTLNSLCIEMDTRYELLKNAGSRNIREYNEKFIARKLNPKNGHKFLPFIVLVIDEFADLIMTAGKEVETPIARLAQLARAIGIHLVIATQRPSVNIITGTIKANFPARIAFRVSSKIDSRTILDTSGAEQLIGKGDMLLSLGSDLVRLQCAFVDTPEVEEIVHHISEQQGYPAAFELPEYISEEDAAKGDFDGGQRDEFFDDAARIIVTNQQGSTSLIQRRMQLGYNRAGRIMDQLEAAGIVGKAQGSKPRDVLIKDLNSLEQKLKEMNEGGNGFGNNTM